jgi:hypothetical protein
MIRSGLAPDKNAQVSTLGVAFDSCGSFQHAIAHLELVARSPLND